MLGCNIYLAERLLKLVEALMIRLLLKQLVCLVVHNHLKVAQVQLGVPLDELVLEIARHRDEDVSLLLLASFTKYRSDLSFA